jgi:hypothetical protein
MGTIDSVINDTLAMSFTATPHKPGGASRKEELVAEIERLVQELAGLDSDEHVEVEFEELPIV